MELIHKVYCYNKQCVFNDFMEDRCRNEVIEIIGSGCRAFQENTEATSTLTPSGLNELAREIHANAVAHGWWDENRSFPEILALCHSELSEALEEHRNGMPMIYCGSKSKDCETAPALDDVNIDGKSFKTPCISCISENKKPEGAAVELADCMIRILDYCGREGIDIDAIIRMKHEYNKTRPYRHGGKKC